MGSCCAKPQALFEQHGASCHTAGSRETSAVPQRNDVGNVAPAKRLSLDTGQDFRHDTKQPSSIGNLFSIATGEKDDLPILDYAALSAVLSASPEPVAVLGVLGVDPHPVTPSLDPLATDHSQPNGDCDASGYPLNGAVRGSACVVVTPRSGGAGAAGCAGGTGTGGSLGGELQLVFQSEQGGTVVSCIFTNAVAVRALKLAGEQDFLRFLGRSFDRDPALRTIFHDLILRLLSGRMGSVKHFVPGDFGNERYFLSMRLSPFVYRWSPGQPGGPSGPGLGELANPGPRMVPAMVLELDVPYEGKELASRMQRDYMILSSIPSIVTVFDKAGFVLHQNSASVAFMGYLVGLEGAAAAAAAAAATASVTTVTPGTTVAQGAGPSGQGAGPVVAGYGYGGGAGPLGHPTEARGSCVGGGVDVMTPLRRLFAADPSRLEAALAAVIEGKEWSGLVRMPPRLEASHFPLESTTTSVAPSWCTPTASAAASYAGNGTSAAPGDQLAEDEESLLLALRMSLATSVGGPGGCGEGGGTGAGGITSGEGGGGGGRGSSQLMAIGRSSSIGMGLAKARLSGHLLVGRRGGRLRRRMTGSGKASRGSVAARQDEPLLLLGQVDGGDDMLGGDGALREESGAEEEEEAECGQGDATAAVAAPARPRVASSSNLRAMVALQARRDSGSGSGSGGKAGLRAAIASHAVAASGPLPRRALPGSSGLQLAAGGSRYGPVGQRTQRHPLEYRAEGINGTRQHPHHHPYVSEAGGGEVAQRRAQGSHQLKLALAARTSNGAAATHGSARRHDPQRQKAALLREMRASVSGRLATSTRALLQPPRLPPGASRFTASQLRLPSEEMAGGGGFGGRGRGGRASSRLVDTHDEPGAPEGVVLGGESQGGRDASGSCVGATATTATTATATTATAANTTAAAIAATAATAADASGAEGVGCSEFGWTSRLTPRGVPSPVPESPADGSLYSTPQSARRADGTQGQPDTASPFATASVTATATQRHLQLPQRQVQQQQQQQQHHQQQQRQKLERMLEALSAAYASEGGVPSSAASPTAAAAAAASAAAAAASSISRRGRRHAATTAALLSQLSSYLATATSSGADGTHGSAESGQPPGTSGGGGGISGGGGAGVSQVRFLRSMRSLVETGEREGAASAGGGSDVGMPGSEASMGSPWLLCGRAGSSLGPGILSRLPSQRERPPERHPSHVQRERHVPAVHVLPHPHPQPQDAQHLESGMSLGTSGGIFQTHPSGSVMAHMVGLLGTTDSASAFTADTLGFSLELLPSHLAPPSVPPAAAIQQLPLSPSDSPLPSPAPSSSPQHPTPTGCAAAAAPASSEAAQPADGPGAGLAAAAAGAAAPMISVSLDTDSTSASGGAEGLLRKQDDRLYGSQPETRRERLESIAAAMAGVGSGGYAPGPVPGPAGGGSAVGAGGLPGMVGQGAGGGGCVGGGASTAAQSLSQHIRSLSTCGEVPSVDGGAVAAEGGEAGCIRLLSGSLRCVPPVGTVPTAGLTAAAGRGAGRGVDGSGAGASYAASADAGPDQEADPEGSIGHPADPQTAHVCAKTANYPAAATTTTATATVATSAAISPTAGADASPFLTAIISPRSAGGIRCNPFRPDSSGSTGGVSQPRGEVGGRPGSTEASRRGPSHDALSDISLTTRAPCAPGAGPSSSTAIAAAGATMAAVGTGGAVRGRPISACCAANSLGETPELSLALQQWLLPGGSYDRNDGSGARDSAGQANTAASLSAGAGGGGATTINATTATTTARSTTTNGGGSGGSGSAAGGGANSHPSGGTACGPPHRAPSTPPLATPLITRAPSTFVLGGDDGEEDEEDGRDGGRWDGGRRDDYGNATAGDSASGTACVAPEAARDSATAGPVGQPAPLAMAPPAHAPQQVASAPPASPTLPSPPLVVASTSTAPSGFDVRHTTTWHAAAPTAPASQDERTAAQDVMYRSQTNIVFSFLDERPLPPPKRPPALLLGSQQGDAPAGVQKRDHQHHRPHPSSGDYHQSSCDTRPHQSGHHHHHQHQLHHTGPPPRPPLPFQKTAAHAHVDGGGWPGGGIARLCGGAGGGGGAGGRSCDVSPTAYSPGVAYSDRERSSLRTLLLAVGSNHASGMGAGVGRAGVGGVGVGVGGGSSSSDVLKSVSPTPGHSGALSKKVEISRAFSHQAHPPVSSRPRTLLTQTSYRPRSAAQFLETHMGLRACGGGGSFLADSGLPGEPTLSPTNTTATTAAPVVPSSRHWMSPRSGALVEANTSMLSTVATLIGTLGGAGGDDWGALASMGGRRGRVPEPGRRGGQRAIPRHGGGGRGRGGTGEGHPRSSSLLLSQECGAPRLDGGGRRAGDGGGGARGEVSGPRGLGDPRSGRGEQERWHEVTVRPCSDPLSSEPVILVIQTDVTSKVKAEAALVEVLEAEHRLLADIFPRHVVRHMTQRRWQEAQRERQDVGLGLLRHIQDPANLATSHECITVLFADIKGFTEMSKQVAPAVVMTFLNQLYTRFDSLTDVYGVYKVETIGDCYMVAGGLVARDGGGYGRAVRGQGDTDPLHAVRVVAFARAMLEEAAKVRLPNTGQPVQVRIGIHSGPATSGVVGMKMPRFCLFGDTVNTASRMESTGRPGCLHASRATHDLLPAEEREEGGWAATGGVEVKGKGRMETFFWSAQTAADWRRRRERMQRAMLLGTLRDSIGGLGAGGPEDGLGAGAGGAQDGPSNNGPRANAPQSLNIMAAGGATLRVGAAEGGSLGAFGSGGHKYSGNFTLARG